MQFFLNRFFRAFYPLSYLQQSIVLHESPLIKFPANNDSVCPSHK